METDLEKLIDTVSSRIVAAAGELTALDAAIGDGDHGSNMKRGLEAVLAQKPTLLALPLPEALQEIGMTLVMKVGGASGPLYGTLLMTLGKELPPQPTLGDLARAFAKAVDAVKLRGKAEVNNKTMLDVLAPVAAELACDTVSFRSVRKAAADGAAATIPMRAIRGRASFLGERSIGHMDPGARSSQIMIENIVNCMESGQ